MMEVGCYAQAIGDLLGGLARLRMGDMAFGRDVDLALPLHSDKAPTRYFFLPEIIAVRPGGQSFSNPLSLFHERLLRTSRGWNRPDTKTRAIPVPPRPIGELTQLQ